MEKHFKQCTEIIESLCERGRTFGLNDEAAVMYAAGWLATEVVKRLDGEEDYIRLINGIQQVGKNARNH